MTDFYETVVGLTVTSRSGERSTLGADGTPLLVLERDANAPSRESTATGLYHNAFRVPSRGALGDAATRIRDRWRLDGASDHRVSEALYLTDPEGNGVEVYRDFPRSEWPQTSDGGVAMGTDPLDPASVEADAAGADGVPAGTDLGHVHLDVSSLDAFEAFTVDTLGFEVQLRTPGALFVSAGGYHHHVGANTWRGRTSPVGGRGLSWFETVVPEPSVLGTVEERIADRGGSVTRTDDGLVVTGTDDVRVRLRAELPTG